MASWATAADLSQRYAVGLARLLDFSRRGNLPMRHDASGTPVFDEDIVMRLFGSRSAPAAEAGASLGTLGSVTLGVAGTPKLSPREVRRREVWRQRRANEPGQESGTQLYKLG